MGPRSSFISAFLPEVAGCSQNSPLTDQGGEQELLTFEMLDVGEGRMRPPLVASESQGGRTLDLL